MCVVCVCVLMCGGRRIGYKVGRLQDPPKFKDNYCFCRLVCWFAHICTLLEDGSRMPEANTAVFLIW